ncbi:unnamed protein product [Cryptosporidium hominis]|uniref:Uncharacterized protein n=1 Tax=Cryptosporidium hominis TaxID=237895 RepID=A0A0S4TES7_CRYHO|nr:hypothetical protein ChTU502y2012_408g0165 [Cryptosporidium hominis]PPA63051.1 hypothetical protein ChUKH1_11005 [Cryptosporidium hominis]CUV05801.1 unnamed protein product [Cryptosporidium hominis]
MSLGILPIYRKLWLIICLAILTLTGITEKVLYTLKKPSNVELSLIKFIGRIKLRSEKLNRNLLNVKSQNNTNIPLLSSELNITNTIKRNINSTDETLPRINASISEIFETKIEHKNRYTSLFALLFGKTRFNLIEETIQNELKLYNYLKAFPIRIKDFEKYIQLYTICSYLSPLLSCEIKEVPNMKKDLFNVTSSATSNLFSFNNISNFSSVNLEKYNQTIINFPWVSSKYSYKWNVISGTYGDVICGKIFGGNKPLFPHIKESSSFFFNTYRNFKSKEYVAYIFDSEAYETNIVYKQLETGKDTHVCIKSFRSMNHPAYFTIWKDENYNLKWLERENWLSGLSNNEKYIKFTPNQVLIVPRIPKNPNHQKGNPLIMQLNEKSLHTCTDVCENSIFYPSVYESHYPWSIVSGKFWSSYLIMEQFAGPSFSDISNFLTLDSVINWIKLSKDNFYIWSACLIHIVYLFFSALISFTFTGSLMYQHCDLHASNLILISNNWEINEDNSFSKPKFQVSFREALSEIISSTIKTVKIIDLTYITYFNAKRRSLTQVCETFGEVSISDVENWQIFTYNLKDHVDNAFSKDKNLSNYINPISTLIKLFESDMDFNLTKPKYVGGSELWWKNWVFDQNKFDDLYDSVLGIGNFFSKAINLVELSIYQNESIPLLSPLKIPYSKVLTNPIFFEVYFKELFYVPYSILSFGTCINQHESLYNNQIYFLTAAETLSHFFLMSSQAELDKLPTWVHKDQVGSKLFWNECIKSNRLFSNSISENFPSAFYFEPCIKEFCVSKKSFSKKIKLWIQEDIQDRDFFINTFKKLILLSSNKISFTLSVLVLNQIKFTVKEHIIINPEKLLQISIAFSNSLSNYLIHQIHEEEPIQDPRLFLSLCVTQYYKHLHLYINLSHFNFGEKLCSKIYKAVFTKFTTTL